MTADVTPALSMAFRGAAIQPLARLGQNLAGFGMGDGLHQHAPGDARHQAQLLI